MAKPKRRAVPNERLRDLFEAGIARPIICAELGLTLGSLAGMVGRLGLKRPEKPARRTEPENTGPWSEEDTITVRDGYREGRRVPLIAVEINRSVKSVWGKIEKMGLRVGAAPRAVDRLHWPESLNRKITQLIDDGLSKVEISTEMNIPVGAIISRLRRMGLTPKRRPPAPRVRTRLRQAPSTERNFQPRRILPPVVYVAPEPWLPPRNYVPVEVGGCHFPIGGSPRSTTFNFCRCPVKTGRPYCPDHCLLAYRGPPERMTPRSDAFIG